MILTVFLAIKYGKQLLKIVEILTYTIVCLLFSPLL